MEKITNVGGRLHNTAVGGAVAGANEIKDDTKGKMQSVINQETDAELLRLDGAKQNKLTFDQTPTEESTNPVTSGGVYAADAALQQAIEAILLLIPSAASALNQLADKAFVNSSISTATATFRGTYNSVTDLHLVIDATHQQIADALLSTVATADNNDYCYVQVPVSVTTFDIRRTERYKFNGTAWAYEYDLNTSGYTAAQWAAINSGITQALVGDLVDIKSYIPAEATSLNQLADKAYVVAQIIAGVPAFKGQFTTLADLQAVSSPKAGDVGIVRTKDYDGYDVFTFYQYLNSQWNIYYTIQRHPQVKPATTGTTGDYPYNGMGCIELPKNIVNGVNTLTQAMMSQTNTKYVIKYDYTLAENITIPANCVLEFDGGSIGGEHTITGQNTGIEAGLVKIFSTDVTLDGSWNVAEAYPEWFGAKGDGVTIDTLPINKVINHFDNIKFALDKTYLTDTIAVGDNKTIKGNGALLKCVADKGRHYIFNLEESENVSIDGLSFDGNSSTIEDYPRVESGAYFCIRIGGAQNQASNITVKNCYFTGSYNSAISNLQPDVAGAENIVIDKCHFKDVGWHGVGMNYWKNSKVVNCEFDTIGLHPIQEDGYGGGLAVDVSAGCQNVVIDSNIAVNVPGGFKTETHTANNTTTTSYNVVFSNNIVKGKNDSQYNVYYGFRLNGANVLCDSNIVEGIVGTGILIDSHGIRATITSNIVRSSGKHGIRAIGGNCVITSNQVDDTNDKAGIEIESDSNLISGNLVRQTGIANGINIIGSYNIVTSNFIESCLGGIRLYANAANNVVRGNKLSSCTYGLVYESSLANFVSDNLQQNNTNWFYGNNSDLSLYESSVICQKAGTGNFIIDTNLTQGLFHIIVEYNPWMKSGESNASKPVFVNITGYFSGSSFSNPKITITPIEGLDIVTNTTFAVGERDGKLVLVIAKLGNDSFCKVRFLPVGGLSHLGQILNWQLSANTDGISHLYYYSFARRTGDKAHRPSGVNIYIGFQYMQVDNTYGTFPIYASAISGSTVTWVKADGTDPDQ